MDLSPGERAVLGQIRVLHNEAAGEQLFRALIGQWPPAHYQAYSDSYARLMAKGLIQATNDQAFRLTDIGLRAAGLARPTPPAVAVRKVERRPIHARPLRKVAVRRSMMSRLVRTLLRRG
jgi:hypothetical protein